MRARLRCASRGGGPPSLPGFAGKVSVDSKGVGACVSMWALADMLRLSKYSEYVTKYCPRDSTSA